MFLGSNNTPFMAIIHMNTLRRRHPESTSVVSVRPESVQQRFTPICIPPTHLSVMFT